jgi:hypothetical protein|tara:strand:- start:2158 stop:3546 length:1389 start_codon:yes stop_codon:yes gene_type:complete
MVQNIFVIGDSQSIFYYYTKNPLIKHHWLGWANLPVTLYELVKLSTLPLYNIVERYSPGDVCKINIKANDVVVFSYGWNDIQKNIHKYNKNNYEEMINSLCVKYISLILQISNQHRIYPIVSCVYPSSQNDENNINIFGSHDERSKYTLLMNSKLNELCNKHNIPYFDIYNRINDNGILNKSISKADGDHLDENNSELREYIETKLINITDNFMSCIVKEKEVTLFITSCGRPNLLKTTLLSFVKYNTYPIKQVILCEDSGIQGSVDFAKDILPYPIEFCYNKERIGQMKTIEKYIKLVETPYVFHLEDDYEFFDYGFIELSLTILKSDNNISQVLLEDEQHEYPKVDIGNPLCYKLYTKEEGGNDFISAFSWRPSLKRLEIALLRIPYKPWDDEYTVLLEVNKRGYYSVVTKNITNGKHGFCRHIGRNQHVRNVINGKKILGRADFPDKKLILLHDYINNY